MSWQWMPQIDYATCTGCGECITRCPTNALGQRDGQVAVIHPDLCTYCTICEDVCPVDAIALPYLIVKDLPVDQNEETLNVK